MDTSSKLIETKDERFYQAIVDLVWDKHKKLMANKLAITMKNFDHVIIFIGPSKC